MTATSPTTTARPAGRAPTGGIVLLVLGVLLTILGGAVLAGGVAAGAAAASQDRSGYLTSPTSLFATDTAALTTPGTAELGGGTAVQPPFDLGRIRIRVEGSRPLFVGIADRAAVDRYLAGVPHTEVTGVRYRPFRAQYRDVGGSRTAQPPTAQRFWVRSASGSGPQQITWPVRAGDWAVVVMNEDGAAGVAARVQAGYHTDLLVPVAAGVSVAGLVLLLVGIPLLLLGTAAIGRFLDDRDPAPTAGRAGQDPVRVIGVADAPLSRWLWLVKWLLAVPHYVVLSLLWVAFLVTTVAAGFVVLFTGRYPRSWFAFDVGVLRWSWRVAFYGYGALGTDRYPPFTLADADYPARLEVARPERLANGLVLVKWWLLALPHLLVLAALTGGSLVLPVTWPWASGVFARSGGSVLGVLVLVAGVYLLFAQRYPRGLFDLIVGIDRWAVRVVVYVALLRDEYPPFRLDQGPGQAVIEPRPPVDVEPAGR